jgi:hypothetical protein
MLLANCNLIEHIIESGVGSDTKERRCCYINGAKDTVFFDCKKQKTRKILVAVKRKMENNRLLDIDSVIADQKFIPLDFIYKRISKDSLMDKYFHIIVVSDKKNDEKSDYWFILNENDLRSKDTIFSYNKTGR